MKSALAAFFALLLVGCNSPHRQVEERPEPLALSEPVLVDDVLQIPKAGTVADVSGTVELMSESNEWVALREGARLSGGAKIHIAPGGSLGVSFRGSEKLELVASPEDRWLSLEVAGAR